MQDLEELRKEISQSSMEYVGSMEDKFFSLIDRLQAAEKDNQDLRMQAIIDFGQYQTAHDELKALREQKPAYDRRYISMVLDDYAEMQTSGLISGAGRYPVSDVVQQSELISEGAQSRDSAEPVGYMDDLGDIIKTKIFKDLGYDAKTTKYNISVYAHTPAKPLATVEAKQSEPLAWKSKTEAYTPYITDSRYQKLAPAFRQWYEPIVEAKQAVPGSGI